MAGRATNEASNYLAFAFQADQTTEGTTFFFPKHLDGSGAELDVQNERVREGGDGMEVGLTYKTQITFDGQCITNARPEVSARLDAALCGADTAAAVSGTATPAAGCNLHTAVPTTAQPYLTAEQMWADNIERGIGARINELSVEFEAGRPLKITHGFMTGGSSYKRPVASALTPTRETGQPFMYPGASVVFEGAAASGINTKMTKGKFSFTRGLDGDIRTTGLNREDVVGLTLDSQFEGTIKYEAASSWYDPINYSVGGTQVPFEIATGAVRVTSRFGSGTQLREKTYAINSLDWTQARVNKLDPEGKTMYIDVVGMGHKSATHQFFSQTLIASVAALV